MTLFLSLILTINSRLLVRFNVTFLILLFLTFKVKVPRLVSLFNKASLKLDLVISRVFKMLPKILNISSFNLVLLSILVINLFKE